MLSAFVGVGYRKVPINQIDIFSDLLMVKEMFRKISGSGGKHQHGAKLVLAGQSIDLFL